MIEKFNTTESVSNMFGLFGRKNGSAPQLDSQENIMNSIKKFGIDRVGEEIRAQAFGGNIECQIFMSQASIQIGHYENAEIFTKLAAESGDVMSQENLALLYMKQVDSDAEYRSEDDDFFISSAKYWYRVAISNGSKSAVSALKNLEVFPD